MDEFIMQVISEIRERIKFRIAFLDIEIGRFEHEEIPKYNDFNDLGEYQEAREIYFKERMDEDGRYTTKRLIQNMEEKVKLEMQLNKLTRFEWQVKQD